MVERTSRFGQDELNTFLREAVASCPKRPIHGILSDFTRMTFCLLILFLTFSPSAIVKLFRRTKRLNPTKSQKSKSLTTINVVEYIGN